MFAKDIPAGDVQTYLIEYRCDTSRGDWQAMVNGVSSLRLMVVIGKVTGGFKYFLFSTLFGEDSHVD